MTPARRLKVATSTYVGKLADPEFRKRRARNAARARTKLSHHVKQVIDRAPALPDDVVEELRQLLPASPDEDREAA
jgi:hypothetical protein